MPVFVDESGDTGLRLGGGSSGQFTVTLIVFPEGEEAEAASHRVDALRADLGLPDQGKAGEFHFNSNSNEQRGAFLRAVAKFGFLIFSVIVNKAGLTSEGIGSKDAFYNLACGLVFGNAKDHFFEANITLDSTGGREFKQRLEKYLKRRMNEPDAARRIKQIRMKPSHTDNLLQLADMVCGAIVRACHEDKKKSDRFRKLIQHREASVLFWPWVREMKKVDLPPREICAPRTHPYQAPFG